MSGNLYIRNARIVNEGEIFQGDIIIRDGMIRKVIRTDENTSGKSLMPKVYRSLMPVENS